MGCFSCFKPSTSEDPFEAETDIVKQVSANDAHVQEEDKQFALAIQRSQEDVEERRRRTRDLAEERGERQNYDNSSSSSLKGKKDGQTSEESLKEKDKRKQFEEHVKQDERLAVSPPPPPPAEEQNNISSRAPLGEDDDEQRIILKSLKDKGQTKPSEDEAKGDGKLVEVIPPSSMCGGCHSEIGQGGSVDVLGVPWHPECFCCGACHNPIAVHEVQNHVSNSRGKFHKNCYNRYCYVCQEKMKIRVCNSHPFWKEIYCPSHDSDKTHKCFSCERLEEPFMNFSEARWSVFALDLIHDRLVLFRKTGENDLNLILMVIRLPKNCELIQFGRHALNVLINGFGAFGIVLELIFELLYVSTRRLGYVAANFSQI